MDSYNDIPRVSWESDHEWDARKSFLESNEEHFSGDRLASLSMAWSNWIFMGCHYSEEIQAVLEDCHARLPAEVDENIKKLLDAATPKVKFVKAAEEELGTRIGAPQGGKHKSTEISEQNYSKYFKKDSSTSLASNVDENHPNHIKGLKVYLSSNTELNTDPSSIFNAIGSIMESCQKCKKSVEFVEEMAAHLFKFTLYIDGRSIVQSFGANKKDAKRQCAEKGILHLKMYQEIVYKDKINHDKLTEIDKKNLVKDSYLSAPKISADNMGSKLLKKMGWDGSSGVGKFSHGISEPVFVESVENRAGFGHSHDDRTVRKGSVETTLLNFLREPSETEIKFSKDLTKEDRALVHRLCTKYHLRHKSFGKNEDRYLVVTK